MPRGHPDWFVDTGQFGGIQSDPMEAAVALGSPAAYSRMGRIVYLTGFEDGLGDWMAPHDGTGPVVCSAVSPLRGDACCKMVASTGAGNYADMQKFIPLLSTSRQGLEWCMWVDDGDADFTALIEWRGPDGGGRFTGYFDILTGTLWIYDGVAGWIDTGSVGGGLDNTEPLYFNCKMVVDPATNKFVYVRVNDYQIDLSQYVADPVGAAWPTRTKLAFTLEVTGLNDRTARLDDVVFTIDEP